MKKFIVMLLITAVFVCGIFASDSDLSNKGQFSKAYTSEKSVSANDYAAMKMTYNPPTGVVYATFGFSNSALIAKSDGHLELPQSPLEELTLTNDVAVQSVKASGSFNVYYEILLGTGSLSFQIVFDEVFKYDDNNQTFKYTKTVGGQSLEGNTYMVEILPGNSSNLVAANIPVAIQTGDLSTISMNKTYSAKVTLKITAGN